MFEDNNNYYSGDSGTENKHPEARQEGSQPQPQYYYRRSDLPPTVAPPVAHESATQYESVDFVTHRQRKLKRRGIARVAAMLALVIVLSGGFGAGAAWYMLQNYHTDAPPAVNSTAMSMPASSLSALESAQFNGNVYDLITNVVKKTASSVVEITTETKQTSFFTGQYVTQGAGSGVVLTADGYIVTNNHVIENASTVIVRTQDGEEYIATLVGTDKQTDLAVIRIEAEGLNPITFADSDAIEVGQLAVAIGNPLGELGGTVTNGIISAKDREITISNESMTLLQTSAAVNPGNSGGGLFDENGNLVGVINAKSAGGDIEGLGFAIPANRVREVTDDLIGSGYVTGRPQFGITVVEVNNIQKAMELGVNEPGVYIVESMPDNGFKIGDRIVSIDSWEIRISSELTDILKTHSVGDQLRVIVKREGREVAFDITLKEKVPGHLAQQEQGA